MCPGGTHRVVAGWHFGAADYVVATFDYPGPGNSTTLFGINERGDIVGDYLDSSSVRRGFVRRLNGTDLWRGSGLSDASK